MKIDYHGEHVIEARQSRDDIDFVITGPLFPAEGAMDRFHASVIQAKMAIDNAIKAQRTADKVKLNLPVYNAGAEPGTITGIHAGNGTVTGQNLLMENHTSYRSAMIYPRVRWIAEAIMKLKIAREEVDRLHGLLRSVQIDCKRVSYGRPDPDRLPRLLEKLQQEYAEQTKKANEMEKQ